MDSSATAENGAAGSARMPGFRKVLLVNLPVSRGHYRIADFPPVGLGYLSQYLTSLGIEHEVFDMMLGGSVSELLQLIAGHDFDLVGFSLFTYQFKTSYRIMETVKRHFPRLAIVAGGPHVSTFREEVLKQCRAVDFGVVMEGEMALSQLCRGEPSDKIAGLLYRQADDVRFNPYQFIQELDQLPFPRFEKFPLERYSANIAVFTSRGCPYDCTYCPVTRTIGKRYRTRTAEGIWQEVQYWYERGYRRILILDDNFTMLPKRVREFCALAVRSNFQDLVFACSNGIRADRVDHELLKEMRAAGFNEIAFGVEAANDRVLKAIKKRETIATIEQRIKEACELDFRVVLFFLIGSPAETFADFLQSVELALRYPVYSARFYNLIPFPHTELFEWVKAKGYFRVPPETYLTEASHHVNTPLFETPEFPYSARKRAFRIAQKVEKKIKRRYILGRMRGPRWMRVVTAYAAASGPAGFLYHRIPVVRRLGLKLRRRL